MKISKSLLWLESYIELAITYYPKIKKLKRLYVLKQMKNKNQLVDGLCHKYFDNCTFDIGLHIKYRILNTNDNGFKLKSFSKLDILSHLAHELSHVCKWNEKGHTIDLKLIELRLYKNFLRKLKKEGYKSEEHEEKNK